MVHQSGPMVKWPKTPASHAGNEGSNPSRVTNICGVYYSEDPPVPIPNTVVKLVCAEDTWRAASRKNRAMPTQPSLLTGLFFLFKNPENLFPGFYFYAIIFSDDYLRCLHEN